MCGICGHTNNDEIVHFKTFFSIYLARNVKTSNKYMHLQIVTR